MKYKISFVAVCATLLTIQLNAQLTTVYTGLRHPESVISDGKFLYITEIGAEMNIAAKDSDGAVVKLTMDGKLITKNLNKSKLNAPKGTAIIGNTLYVADIDRIVGIDLLSGETVATIDFSGYKTNLMNDIAVKDTFTLLATSTDINKVFEINLKNNNTIKVLDITDVQGANGIFFDKKTQHAYVNGVGTFNAKKGVGIVGYINWKNKKAQFHPLGHDQGFFDGMIVLKSGNIVVSDWVSLSQPEGILKQINLGNGKSKMLPIRKIAGPADIFYDTEHNQIFIPSTIEQSLLKLSL